MKEVTECFHSWEVMFCHDIQYRFCKYCGKQERKDIDKWVEVIIKPEAV
jgi:hypothetical protein